APEAPAVEEAAPLAAEVEVQGDGSSYTVEPGDTLSAIAEAHDTTWRQIYADNESVVGDDPDLIHPGQKLTL
ncbi:LysM peptidoglycan-binding domain-containing protein, partial [Streptomyces hainanensis]